MHLDQEIGKLKRREQRPPFISKAKIYVALANTILSQQELKKDHSLDSHHAKLGRPMFGSYCGS
ncbi:hypothetical protein FRX31_002432 [Thalictrum thalictroides]|uniref:Uncharacterized protein n=1 Tax=Thalictrum thalictroides TaxID=46969 RepID=A0A7J6XDV3_THATH|nr:hypothetical protein FRX31_002432 [Thalictrum thalictroides]